jgi:hypothetical protein
MQPYAEVGPVSHVNAGATYGITVPHTGSAAGVFPTTPTELVASLDVDASALLVSIIQEGSSRVSQVKLFAGAASAEAEFAHLIGPAGGSGQNTFYVPLKVPAGTRISATSASSTGFANAYVGITPLRGSSEAPGAARGTPVGIIAAGEMVNIDAGATAHTKGAWAEITASTARDAKGFTLVILNDASSSAAARFLVDVAVGASGSEAVILSNMQTLFEGFQGAQAVVGPIWTPIPAGSRIAARAQCSVTTADTRVARCGLILWE